MRQVRAMMWLSSALVMVGCGGGDGPPREPASGTITVDGRPLAAGMVTFTPAGASGAPVSVLVKDGAYALPRAEGLLPGPHAVSVWGREPTGRTIPDPDDPEKLVEEMRTTVPRRYGLGSELKAQVEAGGANTFTFDLSGKEPAAARAPRRIAASRRAFAGEE